MMSKFSPALFHCILFLRISINSKIILFCHNIYSILSFIILLTYSLVLKLSKLVFFFWYSLVLYNMIVFADMFLNLSLLLQKLIFLYLQVLIIQLLFFNLVLNFVNSVCLLVKFLLMFFEICSCLINIKGLIFKHLNFIL